MQSFQKGSKKEQQLHFSITVFVRKLSDTMFQCINKTYLQMVFPLTCLFMGQSCVFSPRDKSLFVVAVVLQALKLSLFLLKMNFILKGRCPQLHVSSEFKSRNYFDK